MNIHEYQAKEILESFGVRTLPGKVAETPEEAEAIAKTIDCTKYVVKAQIHAGGRGKGCLLYTSPSPRDRTRSRMPSSA